MWSGAPDEDDLARRLTAQAAAGDEVAFEHIFDASFDRLFRYLLVVAWGDEQIARDATQQTMILAARELPLCDSASGLWRWLAAAGRNAAITHRRFDSRRAESARLIRLPPRRRRPYPARR